MICLGIEHFATTDQSIRNHIQYPACSRGGYLMYQGKEQTLSPSQQKKPPCMTKLHTGSRDPCILH